MNEAEAEEEKRRGALSPFTGRIVAIGVVNAETGRSCAMYEVPGQTDVIVRKDGNRTLISGTEKQILEKFWDFLDKGDRFISFNGRQFDGPFLMIRSAIHGVHPKRDLVGNRYRFHPNCDLREVLNFNGTVSPRQMRFNLDLACKSFGIVSSKSDGMDGRAVETLYRAGRYEDIALYCLEDVRATSELYLKLESTLLMFEQAFREAEERARAPVHEVLRVRWCRARVHRRRPRRDLGAGDQASAWPLVKPGGFDESKGRTDADTEDDPERPGQRRRGGQAARGA
jgi:predicted PolB exonuclease-like 3'-5' exonuclease